MRTVNYRDDVLWAIAYQLGLDPEVSFLKNQAYAIASYVNAWVRRLWDSQDWVEWTVIAQFAIGSDHIVTWEAVALDYQPPAISGPTPLPPQPNPTVPLIGKVLKVYLVDPRSTWLPVDTPYRLEHVGIHCGFEHGPSVWIKYVIRAPKFTATEWDSTVTYNKGDLAYSPLSGECYTSKSSNNLGHDPGQPGGGNPLPPPLVAETPGTPDNPGLSATPKITSVYAMPAGPSTNGPLTIVDPPPNGSVFKIGIVDSTGTSLANATHTATGSQSLLTIFTDLNSQLTAALSGFTVTLVTTPQLKITLQNASDFAVAVATYSLGAGPAVLPLANVQTEKYVPSTPNTTGQGQQFVLTITQEQAVPAAVYTLTFTTADSREHVALYTAKATDNAQQVLSGLIDNIIALQPTDAFFTGVHSTLDTVSPNATFTIDKTVGMVSLHPDVTPPGSTFWALIPFPFALVDQVVRGAYADALKESGQSDKAGTEEQQVPTESQIRQGAQVGQQYDALSDQQKQSSRYAIK